MCHLHWERICQKIVKFANLIASHVFTIIACINYYDENEISYMIFTLIPPLLAGIFAAYRQPDILKVQKSAKPLHLGFGAYLLYVPVLNFLIFAMINIWKTLLHGDSVRRSGFGLLKESFDLSDLTFNEAPEAVFQSYVVINRLFITQNSTLMEERPEAAKAGFGLFSVSLGVSEIWFNSLEYAFYGLTDIRTLLTRILLFLESSSYITLRILLFVWIVSSFDMAEILCFSAALSIFILPPLIATLLDVNRYLRGPKFRSNVFTQTQKNKFIRDKFIRAVQSLIFYDGINLCFFTNRLVEAIIIALPMIFNGHLIPLNITIPSRGFTLYLWLAYGSNIFFSFWRFVFTRSYLKSHNSYSAPMKIRKMCKKIQYYADQTEPPLNLENITYCMQTLDTLLKRCVQSGTLCDATNREDLVLNYTESCINSVNYRLGQSPEGNSLAKSIPMKINKAGDDLVFEGMDIDELLKLTYLSIIYYYEKMENQEAIRCGFKGVLEQIASISLEKNSQESYRDNSILNFSNFEQKEIIKLNCLNGEGYSGRVRQMIC